MSRLLEQISESLRARKLFARGQRLLVAVSGGVDSMALLHLLRSLAPAQGWRLTVAHFNHRLRGRSSNADARFVQAAACKLGLPFVGGQGDVRQHARVKKHSIEMAARELRHEFLARTARQGRITVMVLAHHADDQVELFFLRLLRGSGGEGLAGMKWISRSPADARIRLVRPLLDISKAELEAFVRENKIRFREDASNASLDFQRNRVRRELLPLLRKYYQPALTKTILRAIEIVAAEAEFVAAAACADSRPTRKEFAKLEVALQRRVVQRELIACGVEPEFGLIEQLRRHADAPVSIARGVRVSRDASGVVRMCPESRHPQKRTPNEMMVSLEQTGQVTFGGIEISWKIERQRAFRRPKPVTGRECFDADRVGERVVLRHWRAGDRFQPIGMNARVKLQDLFVNAKIPRARRGGLLVAETAGGEIFWVEGLRMGERFKLTTTTRRKLNWSWETNNH